MGCKFRTALWFLSDNGRHFASELFTHVCELVGTTDLFTNTYRAQANCQIESLNRTLLNARTHDVLDHPKDWDLLCEIKTYGYSCQVHSTTKAFTFEPTLARAPPTPIVDKMPDFGESEPGNPSLASTWLNGLKYLVSTTSENMRRAQRAFRENFDHSAARKQIPT